MKNNNGTTVGKSNQRTTDFPITFGTAQSLLPVEHRRGSPHRSQVSLPWEYRSHSGQVLGSRGALGADPRDTGECGLVGGDGEAGSADSVPWWPVVSGLPEEKWRQLWERGHLTSTRNLGEDGPSDGTCSLGCRIRVAEIVLLLRRTFYAHVWSHPFDSVVTCRASLLFFTFVSEWCQLHMCVCFTLITS